VTVPDPQNPPPGADADAPVPGEPARRRLDPLLLVLAGVLAGIAVAASRHPRSGMFVITGALGAGAVLRLLLRPRDAGSLVVRGRHLDVLTLAVLAVTVGVLAAVTPFPAGSG
jgi:hypothetical protein